MSLRRGQAWYPNPEFVSPRANSYAFDSCLEKADPGPRSASVDPVLHRRPDSRAFTSFKAVRQLLQIEDLIPGAEEDSSRLASKNSRVSRHENPASLSAWCVPSGWDSRCTSPQHISRPSSTLPQALQRNHSPQPNKNTREPEQWSSSLYPSGRAEDAYPAARNPLDSTQSASRSRSPAQFYRRGDASSPTARCSSTDPSTESGKESFVVCRSTTPTPSSKALVPTMTRHSADFHRCATSPTGPRSASLELPRNSSTQPGLQPATTAQHRLSTVTQVPTALPTSQGAPATATTVFASALYQTPLLPASSPPSPLQTAVPNNQLATSAFDISSFYQPVMLPASEVKSRQPSFLYNPTEDELQLMCSAADVFSLKAESTQHTLLLVKDCPQGHSPSQRESRTAHNILAASLCEVAVVIPDPNGDPPSQSSPSGQPSKKHSSNQGGSPHQGANATSSIVEPYQPYQPHTSWLTSLRGAGNSMHMGPVQTNANKHPTQPAGVANTSPARKPSLIPLPAHLPAQSAELPNSAEPIQTVAAQPCPLQPGVAKELQPGELPTEDSKQGQHGRSPQHNRSQDNGRDSQHSGDSGANNLQDSQQQAAATTASSGAGAASLAVAGLKKASKWGKLGATHATGQTQAKGAAAFIAKLTQSDTNSLTAAAKRRQADLEASLKSASKATGQRTPLPELKDGSGDAAASALRLAVIRIGTQWNQVKALAVDGLSCEDFASLHPVVQQLLMEAQQRAEVAAHTRAVQQELARLNPVAYSENAAEQAEAGYRALAEKAKLRLKELTAQPGDVRQTGHFLQALDKLRLSRPFFVAPLNKQEHQTRAQANGSGKAKVWLLPESIFWQRKKENDGRAVYDEPKVLAKQLDTDWERVVCKRRFRKLVSRGDAAVTDAAELERELNEIKAELAGQYGLLRSAFIYYSTFGGKAESSSMLQMSLNQFNTMVKVCNIAEPSTPGIRPSDIDTMFISTNYEEESGTQEADANDDNALCRFEFLEICVRMAFGKFIEPKILKDASDSVARLLQHMAATLPSEAMLMPNTFREQRFYTQAMEQQLVLHWDVLQAAFRVYKARDRTRSFWVEHWMALLESTGMLKPHLGVDKHHAKLAFAYSQMTVIDELKRRQRAISLALFDFLEALARLAELMDLPSDSELDAFFEQQGSPPTSGSRVAEYSARVEKGAQPVKPHPVMGGYCAEVPTRPLAEKFQPFMELLIAGLQQAWGGTTEAACTQRMSKMAGALGGGVD